MEEAVLDAAAAPAGAAADLARPDPRIQAWLADWLQACSGEEVYEMDATLDAAALMEIAELAGLRAT